MQQKLLKVILIFSILAMNTSYVSAGIFRVKPRIIRLPSTPKPKVVSNQTNKDTSTSVVPYVVAGAIVMQSQQATSSPKPEYVKKK